MNNLVFVLLYADPFLPRICEVALTSSDRQAKVIPYQFMIRPLTAL